MTFNGQTQLSSFLWICGLLCPLNINYEKALIIVNSIFPLNFACLQTFSMRFHSTFKIKYEQGRLEYGWHMDEIIRS